MPVSEGSKIYYHGLYVGHVEKDAGEWKILSSGDVNANRDDEMEFEFGFDNAQDTLNYFSNRYLIGAYWNNEKDLKGFNPDLGIEVK